MKFSRKLFTAIFLVLISFLCCCSNIFQKEDEALGYVRINIGSAGLSRTLLPVIDNNDIEEIHLLSRRSVDVEYEEVGSWESVSDIPELSFATGPWWFKLVVHTEQCSFSDTSHIEITSGEHLNLSFSLTSNLDKGGMYLKLNLTGNAAAADFTFTEYSTENEVDSGALDIKGTASAHYVEYARRIQYPSEALSEGNYFITITLYGDTDRQLLLNTYEEVVQIKNGFTSKGERTIELNGIYSIEYDLNGGSTASGVTLKTIFTERSADYTLPALTKTGYDFAGWYQSSDFSDEAVIVLAQGSSGNKHFYAKWNPRNDTAYTVKHMYQTIASAQAGTYAYEEDVSKRQTDPVGTTDSNTAAVARNDTGFDALEITQFPIAADGSTVVEVKYNRHLYTVTYADGFDDSISVPAQAHVPFGLTVNVNFDDIGNRPGWSFTGWGSAANSAPVYQNDNITTFTITSNVTLYAEWTANTDTPYTVKHWKEKLNASEGYFLADTETQYGRTNSNANPQLMNYEGFDYDHKNIASINADGTTVIDIYYARQRYTISFAKGADDNSITLPDEKKYFYEQVVNPLSFIASRTGYTFTGWSYNSETYTSSTQTFAMPASDITLTAQWEAASGTAYSVIHYKQQVSGSDYDEVTPHQTLYGITNSLTNAVANSYTGFTAQSVTQETIAADGSTVVEIKYDRNTYTVTYDDGVTSETITVPSSETVRYGANVDVDFTTSVTRPGYTFAGWSDGTTTYTSGAGGTTSFTMGTLNVTLTAQWTANTNTQYKVRHYQQNIDDDLYTEVTADYETKNDGTTDAYKTPTAKNYAGFTVRTPITQILVTGDGLAEGAVYYNRNTHSVSYASGVSGGTAITLPSGQASVKYGTSVTPVFTGMGTGTSGRTGYTFAGWKYDTTTWTSGGGQAPLSMPDSDVTFTAQWTINSYTVTYLPGATDSSIALPIPLAVEKEYNSTVDLNFAASRDYYDFAGWKRGATTYTSTGTTSFTMPAEDVNLTAQWTPVDYDITYDFNGGAENATLNPATYNIESDFELAAPTRTDGDYRFGGWYTDLDDPATQVEGFSPGDHGAITLKAKWLPLYAEVGSRKAYTKDEAINYINTSSGLIYVTLTGAVTATDLGDYNTNDTICYTLAHKNATYDSIFLTVQSDANIQLTTCKQLFKNCAALKSADLRGLKVSNVTNMQSMFDSCTKLSSVDVSGWDTSKVQNMSYLFNSCENLQAPDLSSWDTSAVTEMDYMFNQCKKISVLDLSNFDTSSVTSMCYMFSYCEQLSELNLLSFDTSSVNYMYYMFASVGREVSSSYTSIYVSTDFVVKPGANTEAMFNYSKIEGGAGTKHEVTQGSDTNQGTYARIDGGPSAPGYFTELPYIAKVGNKYCTTLAAALDKIENSSGELNIVLGSLATQADIGKYSTSGTIIYAIKNNCGASTVNLSVASGVTITFTGSLANMFEGCTKLKSADLRGFNTSAVTGMGSMFNGCTNLESVNLSSFDTHSVTSMTSMFQGCSKVTELDLSSFNLQSVTSMSNMFKSCSALKHITFSQNPNTAALQYLNGAFSYCSALTELDLSGFNTSNLEALYEMCRSCTALKYINLSGFECPNVGSFEAMFAYCSNLEILDLRDLAPTVSVTNVALMFVSCDNLRKIFVNTDFVTKVEGATNDVNMFNGCAMLAGEISTTFATAGVTDGSYAKIDGGPSNPGYFSGVTNYARVGDAYYSNKDDTVSAILNSTGDFDVVLYRVSVADIGAPTTSGTIAYAISNSSDASIRLIVDRNSGLVVNNSNTISFSGCEKLVYADLRGLDLSVKASLSALFYGCTNLKSVNLAGNTPSLNNVSYLFPNCTALEEVDISGWNFNVSAPNNLNCSGMFSGCTSLKVIYASYDFPSTVTAATDLFKNCTALKGGAGTEFDPSSNSLSHARIDGGPNNPGYFTYRAP